MSLREHLLNVRGRLSGEVGFLLEAIIARNKRKPQIGFFALTRMLMPIIETVARAEGLRPVELLERLEQPSANLVWALYRNVFSHNDEFQYGRVGRRGISTGMMITEEDNVYVKKVLARTSLIDLGFLYRQLVNYLDKRIDDTKPTKKVQYISGIWYPRSRGLTKTVLAELKKQDTGS